MLHSLGDCKVRFRLLSEAEESVKPPLSNHRPIMTGGDHVTVSDSWRNAVERTFNTSVWRTDLLKDLAAVHSNTMC